MAVPKKRKSKSKTNIRKAVWKKQASVEAIKAISKAKSAINTLIKQPEEKTEIN